MALDSAFPCYAVCSTEAYHRWPLDSGRSGLRVAGVALGQTARHAVLLTALAAAAEGSRRAGGGTPDEPASFVPELLHLSGPICWPRAITKRETTCFYRGGY
jgi:hypothetical protein